ncbi:MAG TPA: hypothetical protein VIT66_04365 [Lysobacter sp.]
MPMHPPKKPAPSRAGFFLSGFFPSGVRSPLLLAALVLAHCAVAIAQVDATGDYLSRMDSDHDGRVALTEYQDWMSYAFMRMDLDGDGVLTPAELPGGRGNPVSLIEHREKLASTFGRQDRNRDGFLDARELAAPPQ